MRRLPALIVTVVFGAMLVGDTPMSSSALQHVSVTATKSDFAGSLYHPRDPAWLTAATIAEDHAAFQKPKKNPVHGSLTPLIDTFFNGMGIATQQFWYFQKEYLMFMSPYPLGKPDAILIEAYLGCEVGGKGPDRCVADYRGPMIHILPIRTKFATVPANR